MKRQDRASKSGSGVVYRLPETVKLSYDIREPSQSFVWQALSHFNTTTTFS